MPQALLSLQEWKTLQGHAQAIQGPENHLKQLLGQADRLDRFSCTGGGLFFDFSRQRLTDDIFSALMALARVREIQGRFGAMMAGETVNVTENRAALHTAARRFSPDPLTVDGQDVMAAIRRVRGEMREFAQNVREGRITGASGKPFAHIVVIGIGGSHLGTEFVSTALAAFARKDMHIHYLANVDPDNFGRVAKAIDPETTLWIVISKSYTTAETLANANLAYGFMREKGLDPADHVVTVTSKGSPGDDPKNPVLAAFHMFDFIGGRYSVSSAVGGVPLSLYLGYERFEEFLKGASEMDHHAATAPAERNLPLIAALIGVWNNNFLGYPAQAIIPYADPLCKLASHVQQLYMESNGKSVTANGTPVDGRTTGMIIFGEPGTNAQHSFFQLAHQGRPFPIDFIGVIHPQYAGYTQTSRGVTNHQELWANLLSQPMALAMGKDDPDPARAFSGNRPSSTILLEDLSPKNVGRLLAFYEHRTVFEAFLWGINPFDQFGVELGKKLATQIREAMAERNARADHPLSDLDAIAQAYLNKLFSGKISG